MTLNYISPINKGRNIMINFNNPTENEIRRLVNEAADPNNQITIIADLTGKSKIEIRKICGMKTPEKKKYSNRGRPSNWTEEKIAYLYDHPDESAQSIADKLCISSSAVSSMKYQLGIKKTSTWTDEQTMKLIEAYERGLRGLKIAKMLKMDLPKVQKKIVSLRYAGRIK